MPAFCFEFKNWFQTTADKPLLTRSKVAFRSSNHLAIDRSERSFNLAGREGLSTLKENNFFDAFRRQQRSRGRWGRGLRELLNLKWSTFTDLYRDFWLVSLRSKPSIRGRLAKDLEPSAELLLQVVQWLQCGPTRVDAHSAPWSRFPL